ncbi:thioredoxin family protein [Flavobacterium sp.]|jgi:thioredoxin-related protein|uniref:thioredoxin family protein n=1 Tax=Flavobacterium sp. TaxID=239 RepID=UPI0025F742BE|nr:thioredoxin family protein [Flavobacterium sp.]
MKKIIITLVFVLGSISLQAQELYWETNVNKAIEVSKKTKKPLLLFFTGSDWCGWCIRLQKEVLRTPEFATWAKDNVVLVELDYPRSKPQTNEIKQQNGQLQQIFGIQGYPTVFFSNVQESAGKINFQALGNTGYVAGGPKAWLAVADGILKKK